MNFEIKLPLFEGPFDLLLFFIERDELNIYDIPIARITTDFLAYMQALEQVNIELASEFVLVAATLMKIKAKMLLPKPPSQEQADPREELVNALLEYQKYQSVLGILGEMEAIELQKEVRNAQSIEDELKNVAQHYDLDLEVQSLDLYQLLKVYQKVLDRQEVRQNQPVHTIIPYPYSVAGQKEVLRARMMREAIISFATLIQECPLKIVVIFNFLAILELLQLGEINIILEEGFNNFSIQRIQMIAQTT